MGKKVWAFTHNRSADAGWAEPARLSSTAGWPSTMSYPTTVQPPEAISPRICSASAGWVTGIQVSGWSDQDLDAYSTSIRRPSVAWTMLSPLIGGGLGA